MNKDRRKALEEVKTLLTAKAAELSAFLTTWYAEVDSLKDDLETYKDEEQEYYDNMPEGLQAGQKGDEAQEAIDALEEAMSELDDQLTNFDSAKDDDNVFSGVLDHITSATGG
jgi:flagellar biosynthesis chaperone FliJ